MKKVIRLTESDLTRIIKQLVNEQYNDKLVDEINGGDPIGIFADKSETKQIGLTYFAESFVEGNGVVNLYPENIKFSDPSENKNDYRVLVFKCGVDGFRSKTTSKTVYNRRVYNLLKNKFCKK